MSYFFYFTLILLLVAWIESSFVLIPESWRKIKRPGEDLEAWLKNFNSGLRLDLTDKPHLPKYKFYTEVVEILLFLARKMGGNFQDSLLFLREGLNYDLQSEKKIKEIIRGMYLHMALFMFLTWGFIGVALSLVDTVFPWFKLLGILGWQILGIGVVPFAIKILRKKYFSEMGILWKILLVLKSLLKVPISQTQLFSLAGIQNLEEIKGKNLENIITKLKETCQKTLKLGVSYDQDLTFLMEELRFQEKWHFDLFEKRLTAIKLVILSVFFLPSYLAFVFVLLSDLITTL